MYLKWWFIHSFDSDTMISRWTNRDIRQTHTEYRHSRKPTALLLLFRRYFIWKCDQLLTPVWWVVRVECFCCRFLFVCFASSLKVKGPDYGYLYTATYQNSSCSQCEVAYWPALAVGSTTQFAAADCPNERTWTRSLQLDRPTYAPSSRTMPFTPQCSQATTHYCSSDSNQILIEHHEGK